MPKLSEAIARANEAVRPVSRESALAFNSSSEYLSARSLVDGEHLNATHQLPRLVAQRHVLLLLCVHHHALAGGNGTASQGIAGQTAACVLPRPRLLSPPRYAHQCPRKLLRRPTQRARWAWHPTVDYCRQAQHVAVAHDDASALQQRAALGWAGAWPPTDDPSHAFCTYAAGPLRRGAQGFDIVVHYYAFLCLSKRGGGSIWQVTNNLVMMRMSNSAPPTAAALWASRRTHPVLIHRIPHRPIAAHLRPIVRSLRRRQRVLLLLVPCSLHLDECLAPLCRARRLRLQCRHDALRACNPVQIDIRNMMISCTNMAWVIHPGTHHASSASSSAGSLSGWTSRPYV